MRGIRAIVVTATCVPAGVLTLGGSTMADPGPAPPAMVLPAQVQGPPSITFEPAPYDPGMGPDAGPGGDSAAVGREYGTDVGYGTGAAPRTSYATRHVPTPEEAALTGAVHPATDRVMTYLIAWVMMALVGGGLLAGRDRDGRVEQRHGR